MMLLNASKKRHYTDVELTVNDVNILLSSLAAKKRELSQLMHSRATSDDLRADAAEEYMIVDKLAARLYDIWLEIR